ncbi:MAG TPA: hypothetical protein VLT88_00510, partial [Desulfosarcina sp.]|nr:hypothetical protein [Desulfosarcina sp.]
MVALRRTLLPFFAAFWLASCQTATSTPALAPDSSPAPTRRLPTPTATLAASIEVPRLLEGSDGRPVAAGALTNESDDSVQDIILEIEFLDS